MFQARANAVLQGKVLVADDDALFRSLVGRQLAMLGAVSVEAESGGAAWQLALHNGFDLALVDLDMPGVAGQDLIACLRGHPHTRHMPIVVITAHSDNAVLREALGKGATACLTKPVNWSTFAGYIDHLLTLGAALRGASEQSTLPPGSAPAVLDVAAEVRLLLALCRRFAAKVGDAPDLAADARAMTLSLSQLLGKLEPRGSAVRTDRSSSRLRRERDVA